MGVGASYAELVAPLVAIGFGIALVLPNVASAALGSALPEHIGKASGANSTFRQLGAVFGIAVAVLVFDRAGSYGSPGAVVDGARAALFVAAAVGVLGAPRPLGIPARARTRAASAAGPAPRIPLAELETRQRHAARAARVEAARGAGGDEASDHQAQAAVGDHAVRQPGHADQTARWGTLAASRAGSPADPADRRLRPAAATGTRDDHERSAARRAPRGTAAQASPEEPRARTPACARKLPRLARSVAATSKRAHGSLQIVIQNTCRRERASSSRAHVSGELPGQRRASPAAASCTSSGTRAASSGERRSTATSLRARRRCRGWRCEHARELGARVGERAPAGGCARSERSEGAGRAQRCAPRARTPACSGATRRRASPCARRAGSAADRSAQVWPRRSCRRRRCGRSRARAARARDRPQRSPW